MSSSVQKRPVTAFLVALLSCLAVVRAAAWGQAGTGVQERAPDPAALRQLKAAARFFQEGKYDFAADTYREFLNRYGQMPEAEEARFFLAESLMLLKRYDEAHRAYQDYLQRHPDGRYLPWARFRLGESAFLAGRWQEAIEQLRAYVSQHGGHRMVPYAERYIGEALLKLGRNEEAERQLRATIRRYPKLPVTDHARYALAQLLEAQQQRDEALQFYLVVGQGNSSVADDALLAAGTIEYAAGRYAHAQKLFETLLQRFPQSKLRWTAHFNAGLSLFRQKRYAAAEGHFMLVAGARKGDELGLEAAYWLGRCLAEQGNGDEAARRLAELADQAVKAGKVDLAARALYESARTLAQSGDVTAAVTRYLAVASRFPEHELAEQAAAQAVFTAARSEANARAIELADSYLQTFPEGKRRAQVALAAVRAALAERKPDVAERWVRIALQDGDQTVIRAGRYYRALIEADRGAYAQAVQTLDPLLTDAETARVLPEAYFLAGRCAYQLGRYADALKALAVFLQTQPDEELAAHARAYRVVSLAHLGQFDGVLEELQQLADTADVRIPAALAAADAFYDREAYEPAATLYGIVVAAEGVDEQDRAYALAGRAWARFYAGRIDEALSDADEFLKRYADHKLAAEMLLLTGFAHKQAGAIDKALAAFDRLVRRYADSDLVVDALLARARLLVQADRSAEALAAYADALAILRSGQQSSRAGRSKEDSDRDLAGVLGEYAWALWKAGKVDEAIAHYRELIQRFPDAPGTAKAELNLAQLLLDRNDPVARQEAVALATKHLSAGDSELRAEASFLLARAAFAEADWSQVEKHCRNYLEIAADGPRAAQVYYMLVEALYEQQKGNELGDTLQRALAVTNQDAPWRGRLLLRRAQWLIGQRRWQEAIEALRPLLGDPSNSLRPVAEYYRGRALYEQGKLNEALAAFKEALAAEDAELAARAQFMIGETLFAQRQFRAAIREFLKVDLVYDVSRWRAAALVEAGKCYEQLREWRAAREVYERVLKEFPDEPVRQEAERRLKAIQTMSAMRKGTG